jgi:hypothetical protein
MQAALGGIHGRESSAAWLWRRFRVYARHNLLRDAVAGATVGSLIVPQSMAYALLAGLPPEMGLYTSFMPLLGYAIFGSSSHLAVGPVSVICVLVSIQLGDLRVPADERPAVAALLAALVGALLVLLGGVRLGFVQHLLSHAVLSGFMSGVAVVIAIEQLDALLGLPMDDSLPRGQSLPRLAHCVEHLGEANVPSVLLSAGTVALLVVALEVQRRRPHAVWPRTATLLLTLLGTLLCWALGLPSRGVGVLGKLHVGLPALSLSFLEAADTASLQQLLPKAATASIACAPSALPPPHGSHGMRCDAVLRRRPRSRSWASSSRSPSPRPSRTATAKSCTPTPSWCQCYAMLCCAVLCYAMLCCAMLCCAVLCCAMLCCVMLCRLRAGASPARRPRPHAAGPRAAAPLPPARHTLSGTGG